MTATLSTVSAPAASHPDGVLLRTWVQQHDEEAFRALAHRHLNLVMATACRCTGHPALAEEAAQMVLTILARKAASLERVPLGPWLHRTTMLECRALLRRESRHRRRVNALAAEPPPEPCAASSEAWREALPVLDEMIDRLGDEDRRVLILRFFEDMSFREIAGRIGKSEAAVQRQGHRALERLALLLRRRGVVVPSAALIGGLGIAHATVPAGALSKIVANVFAAAGPQPGAAALFLNTLYTMSQTKVALATAAVLTVLAAVPIGLQYRENSRLARELTAAESRLSVLTAALPHGGSGTASAKSTTAADSQASSGDKVRRISDARKSSEEKNSGEKKPNLLAGFGEYLENPQMKKMLEAQITSQIEALYGPFIDSLSLSPDERKHLLGIMTGSMVAATQDAFKAMGSPLEERQKLNEVAKARTAEQRERIREFLNDENDYNRYVAWEDRLQEHQTISAVQGELQKRGVPLDKEKEQALIELMYQERKASPYTNDFSNPQQDISFERPFNDETIDGHVNEMAALHERVATAAAARGLLTQQQLESFRAGNRSHVEMTRTSLKMAASLMGGLKGSGQGEAK